MNAWEAGLAVACRMYISTHITYTYIHTYLPRQGLPQREGARAGEDGAAVLFRFGSGSGSVRQPRHTGRVVGCRDGGQQ